MLKRDHILRTIWMHVLIPLTVLTLYLVSFTFFYSWLLPEYSRNVNAVFVSRAWKYSLLLAAVSYLIFFVLFKRTKGSKLTFGDSIEKVGAIDFILILLPLTPVLQYILNNQDILSPLASLYVLAAFVVFAVLFVIAIPRLLGIVGSTKTLMLMGMAFTFMITNMASLSDTYNWFEAGSLWIQLIIFGAVFFAGWLLYNNRITRKFVYFFVAIFFITSCVTPLVSGDPEKMAPGSIDADNKLVELVGSKEPLSTPNIYLLVYDAYVINGTMLQYGIDNSAQEEFLETLGFKLYPHTYSVGVTSIRTMSRVLNASTEFYGNIRRGVSGGGIVHKLLKSFGYETYGIFLGSHFFQGIGSSYDFSNPEVKETQSQSTSQLLIKAIFMGEFRFDVDFEAQGREHFVEYKTILFNTVSKKPRFVYMHDPKPGHCRKSEDCISETERYMERLTEANYQMKQDVEAITQKDPDAIIVVAGDHGPLLTKNCVGAQRAYDISEISSLHIQDRFGTFLAIKWPTQDFSEYDDIIVLQDIFPAIFAYLFEDNQLLEAKVEPKTVEPFAISGASVVNGIIYGGINDGEPLFVNQE